MPRAYRKTCTNHCSACGAHFHSLSAFDLHLHRINQGKNRWGARTYDLQHSTDRLEAWTTEGYCDLTSEVLHPVTVWCKPLTDAQRRQLAVLRLRSGSEKREVEP